MPGEAGQEPLCLRSFSLRFTAHLDCDAAARCCNQEVLTETHPNIEEKTIQGLEK